MTHVVVEAVEEELVAVATGRFGVHGREAPVLTRGEEVVGRRPHRGAPPEAGRIDPGVEAVGRGPDRQIEVQALVTRGEAVGQLAELAVHRPLRVDVTGRGPGGEVAALELAGAQVRGPVAPPPSLPFADGAEAPVLHDQGLVGHPPLERGATAGRLGEEGDRQLVEHLVDDARLRGRVEAGRGRQPDDLGASVGPLQHRARPRRVGQLRQPVEIEVALVPEPARDRGVRTGVEERARARREQGQGADDAAAEAVDPAGQPIEVAQVGSDDGRGLRRRAQRVERREHAPQPGAVAELVHLGGRHEERRFGAHDPRVDTQRVAAHGDGVAGASVVPAGAQVDAVMGPAPTVGAGGDRRGPLVEHDVPSAHAAVLEDDLDAAPVVESPWRTRRSNTRRAALDHHDGRFDRVDGPARAVGVERLDGTAAAGGAGPSSASTGSPSAASTATSDSGRRRVPLALDVPVPRLDAVRARVRAQAFEQLVVGHGLGASGAPGIRSGDRGIGPRPSRPGSG